MKLLQQLQASLEQLNGYHSPYKASDFLMPSQDCDQLLIKEDSSISEVLICLDEGRLKRLSNKNFPADFNFDLLPDLSVVIEEISHFNTYCLSAEQDREISPIELEVQGEIDKFGVALDFLYERNELEFQEKLFETLFGECQVGNWVSAEDQNRYQDAHRIARNFCRDLMDRKLGREDRRAKFREFFASPSSVKLTPKY